MTGQVLIYFSWSRPGEADLPLTDIDDRFPALFELRRLFYPRFEGLSDPTRVDQGIRGFLDHVQKENFQEFARLAGAQSGFPVRQVERVADDGRTVLLDAALLSGIDTAIVISFDSLRTSQGVQPSEVEAVQNFLRDPAHLIAICPHHDIGGAEGMPRDTRAARQLAEHLHHGDAAIPPRQAFGGFARTLLAGLGVPVLNRHGLRPAVRADGSPEPIEVNRSLDRLQLLAGVDTFNLHPHLPQLERLDGCAERMDVIARQRIDLTAPAHPDIQDGQPRLDALLQSRATAFAGTLLVGDTTLWSATAGGLDSLRRFWSNVVNR